MRFGRSPVTVTTEIWGKPMSHVEDMLSDATIREKLVAWAVEVAVTRAYGSDRERAWKAASHVTALWRQTIFPHVLDQLEKHNTAP
jgi:hypothetical protein